jgi:hypothetical protein
MEEGKRIEFAGKRFDSAVHRRERRKVAQRKKFKSLRFLCVLRVSAVNLHKPNTQ